MTTNLCHYEIVLTTYFLPVEFIDLDQSIWECIEFYGDEFWNSARMPFKTDERYDKEWYGNTL